jgi:hypothetical protein
MGKLATDVLSELRSAFVFALGILRSTGTFYDKLKSPFLKIHKQPS